jgi:hypothetical protein
MEELAHPSDTTVATLNYDGLLHYGFLHDSDGSDWCDMADGRGRQVEPADFSDGFPLPSWPLRTSMNFVNNRARLLNLHGSLGWLRHSSSSLVPYRKFRLDDLRGSDYWSKLNRGETDWEPVVVLTSAKDSVPERYPYSLAYGALQASLVESDHWLIAGYGFGDSPVNDTFRRAVAARRRLGAAEPRVLIIGTDSRRKLKADSRRLGLTTSSVSATDVGLPDAVRGPEWEIWAEGVS